MFIWASDQCLKDRLGIVILYFNAHQMKIIQKVLTSQERDLVQSTVIVTRNEFHAVKFRVFKNKFLRP